MVEKNKTDIKAKLKRTWQHLLQLFMVLHYKNNESILNFMTKEGFYELKCFNICSINIFYEKLW